jgi:hypothetical protein
MTSCASWNAALVLLLGFLETDRGFLRVLGIDGVILWRTEARSSQLPLSDVSNPTCIACMKPSALGREARKVAIKSEVILDHGCKPNQEGAPEVLESAGECIG